MPEKIGGIDPYTPLEVGLAIVTLVFTYVCQYVLFKIQQKMDFEVIKKVLKICCAVQKSGFFRHSIVSSYE